MAATRHIGIRAAVAALLAASTPLAGGRIHQNRDYVLNKEEPSAIWVHRLDSEPGRVVTGRMDWQTEIAVTIRTRTSGGTSADDAADALSEAVYSRIMATPTIGGLAIDTMPGPMTWEQDEADTAVAVCTLRFAITHRTSEGSISS